MTNPRTIDWASPATGDIIEKKVIEGQRVMAGDELFRIADHSRVWVVAEVAEADIAAIKVGMPATVTLRAFPTEPHEGVVTFIYPEMMKPETRTISVRIELPNPDGKMKTGMYADVVFQRRRRRGGGDRRPRQRHHRQRHAPGRLVAKGEGRFEPRAVKLGRRGEGYTEIIEGLKLGEEVVTSATFLIDAESNLKAALQSFSQRSAAMIAAHHPLVGPQRLSRRARHALRDGRRHLCGLPRAARRHPRPLRRAGHRLHRVSRPGAAGRRGPGHLSADHRDADRAEVARRARLLLLRRVLRLCDLRGRHRYLLGALARARISELRRAAAAGRRDAEPRARRHRRRLGLSICGARRADDASPSCAPSRIGTSASGSPRRRAWRRSRASAASSSNTAW